MNRFGRRLRVAVLGALLTVAGLGFQSGRHHPARPIVPVAYAACGGSHGVVCDGPKSSLLRVSHIADIPEITTDKVEPESGETFTAVVYWATTSGGSCACTETSASATIRVDWDQTNNEWDVTCTSGCNGLSGPIFGVSICDDDRCLADLRRLAQLGLHS